MANTVEQIWRAALNSVRGPRRAGVGNAKPPVVRFDPNTTDAYVLRDSRECQIGTKNRPGRSRIIAIMIHEFLHLVTDADHYSAEFRKHESNVSRQLRIVPLTSTWEE